MADPIIEPTFIVFCDDSTEHNLVPTGISDTFLVTDATSVYDTAHEVPEDVEKVFMYALGSDEQRDRMDENAFAYENEPEVFLDMWMFNFFRQNKGSLKEYKPTDTLLFTEISGMGIHRYNCALQFDRLNKFVKLAVANASEYRFQHMSEYKRNSPYQLFPNWIKYFYKWNTLPLPEQTKFHGHPFNNYQMTNPSAYTELYATDDIFQYNGVNPPIINDRLGIKISNDLMEQSITYIYSYAYGIISDPTVFTPDRFAVKITATAVIAGETIMNVRYFYI